MDQFTFPYQQYLKGELPAEIQTLVEAADKATQKAYAPYSKLKVGAAVLMADGSIVSGANQENAAFPAGICAERAVLASVDINENSTVKAIAVSYSEDEKMSEKPIAPCGLCRQTILEVQHRQQSPITIYMCAPGGLVIMVEDAEFLLPFFFGSDHLPTFKPQV